MPSALVLGPFALPLDVALDIAFALLYLLTAHQTARKIDLSIDRLALISVTVAFAVSRGAFIWEFREAYLGSPWDILDLRDGGWEIQIGVIGGWLYLLAATRALPKLRKPLLRTAAAYTVAWTAIQIVILLVPQARPELPVAEVQAFEGGTQSLAAFKGKATVVNLWATWCPPCQHELPVFQKAQSDYPDVQFVFLNQGETSGKVAGFLRARGLNLRNVLLDPKGLTGAKFGSSALPTTLFFDLHGKLVDLHIGELSHATLAQQLLKLHVESTSK
jgi:thiol-disulfide isomerase/thioredoxin